MIGNDIVDLRQALRDSNWQRPRYLQKIFTAEEQHFIAHSKNQDLAVWTLWSRKEAVYKIIARQEHRSFFAPKKIIAQDLINADSEDLAANGIMRYTNSRFITQSYFSKNYIHTIAQQEAAQSTSVFAKCFRLSVIPQNLSKLTKAKILLCYAQQYGIPVHHLSIQKNEIGVPFLYLKNKLQALSLSIAHHGQYGSFAIK